VNEGGPRLVHESFLCGTQVISTGGGGLDDLLNCSNGYKITLTNDTVLDVSYRNNEKVLQILKKISH
jgi:energy-converting hydrogenase Eha subunit F